MHLSGQGVHYKRRNQPKSISKPQPPVPSESTQSRSKHSIHAGRIHIESQQAQQCPSTDHCRKGSGRRVGFGRQAKKAP